MRCRSLPQLPAIALSALPFALAGHVLLGQGTPPGRLIDEGTFMITAPGVPAQTESFRILRDGTGGIVATGQLIAGSERIASSLTTDTLGTPIDYDLTVHDRRVQTMHLHATTRGGRMSSMSSDQAGNESMRQYPVSPGSALILDDELRHQLYFVTLGRRSGNVHVISPRGAHSANYVLVAHGMEPIQVADRTITATHYSLGAGPAERDFWVDASGRLLKVTMPEKGIVAVRDEAPR